jgi:hypothetical protein
LVGQVSQINLFVCVVLGFELRALHLLGRLSAT